jgi:hypothetical protein
MTDPFVFITGYLAVWLFCIIVASILSFIWMRRAEICAKQADDANRFAQDAYARMIVATRYLSPSDPLP